MRLGVWLCADQWFDEFCLVAAASQSEVHAVLLRSPSGIADFVFFHQVPGAFAEGEPRLLPWNVDS